MNSVLQSLDSATSADDMFAPRDKRGTQKPLHATPDHALALIDEHIESFHLSVSHYRREHAPNTPILVSRTYDKRNAFPLQGTTCSSP